MAENQPTIRELHRTLTAHHREIGGKVLHAYHLSSRIFETRDDSVYTAWGADYDPTLIAGRSLRFFSHKYLDWRYARLDPLGIPYGAPCEAWFSIARAIDDKHTKLTRFEYDAGTWDLGGGMPWVQVSTTHLNNPLGDLALEHMRGGLGFSRELPLDFTQATPGQTAELTSALIGLIASFVNAA